MLVDTAEGRDQIALNAVCPYYTMFPLSFPVALLRSVGSDDAVLDPFCGRGTTLFAARLAGIHAVGIDSNQVAVTISRAKLSAASESAIVALATKLLRRSDPDSAPEGEFWSRAYAPKTLDAILHLRAGLRDLSGPTSEALRAIVLGALHGPLSKSKASYFSNQMPRTFASKPAYSIRYWAARNMEPPEVDVLEVIRDRASRYFGTPTPHSGGRVLFGDARDIRLPRRRFTHVITSPPYFGMRSYVPDQWIRDWFIGGPPTPTYVQPGQLGYEGNSDPAKFATELGRVWSNVAPACRIGTQMTIRFGAIRSRPCDPVEIIRSSLLGIGEVWRIDSISAAGDAHQGRRQADLMGTRGKYSKAVIEYDISCTLVR
ncbi:DNA methyltransferase [Methylobacterium sp. NPDC097178]|uniref:DNA methyltransferase n=1 Tax=Methylobacterium TaxID=407 RepID=UPI0036FCE746